MADTSRIEELRRRVQRDPASIAFAQLAEEYRRAGRYQEAIDTCESGLAHHPGYLSARVTLGRSLVETGELDAAQLELKQVLRAAPENLAALRGLAEIHHRRGELQEALAHYRTALEFARHDPELEHLVEEISKELEPQAAAPVVVDGMSFEEVKDAFLNLSSEEPAAPVDPAPGVETGAVTFTSEAEEEPPTLVEAGGDDRGQDEALTLNLPAESLTEQPFSPAEESAPGFDPPTFAEPDAAPAVSDASPMEPAAAFAQPEPAFVPPIPDAVQPEPDAVVPVLDVVPPMPDAVVLTPDPVAPMADVQTAPDAVPLPEDEQAAAAPAVSSAAAAGPQVDALERWLEVILAERQRRS